jgi:hypothetical protein
LGKVERRKIDLGGQKIIDHNGNMSAVDNDDDQSPPPGPTRNAIQQLPVDSVRRIVAGQAILDLSSCVKELIDNALDAGSTNINGMYDTGWFC